MLGSVPGIGGIDDAGAFTNPDANNNPVAPQALADFQGQLNPDPDHHFPAVDVQIYGGATGKGRAANMQGFVTSYFRQQQDVGHSQKIMYYFKQSDLPVLTTLALQFAVFNRWFASIPGPTICNRAFAHYGTSFGRVDMDPFDVIEPIKSIYTRLVTANHKAKVYYYDTSSSTMEVANLLQHQTEVFGTYPQFLSDCDEGLLQDYSFVEPNYSDHDSDEGEEVANDQHPDHDVQAGEELIAEVYTHIKNNPKMWASTALLIVYDEHGGIFDHVPPPSCPAGSFHSAQIDPGTGQPFMFDRLGVRVPAILVSPWVPKGTIVGRTFDHASIPATITKFFLGSYPHVSLREQNADVFIEPNDGTGNMANNLLSLDVMRNDCPDFTITR
jgi:phospholipase C